MAQVRQKLPLLCISYLLLLISLGGCGGSSSSSDQSPSDTAELSLTGEPLVTAELPITEGSLVSATSDASFVGEHYSGSGTCASCHDGLTSSEGDISIVKKWSTSMMANASRDPYWQAKFSSELSRNPQLSEELNNTCSRCHTPMANDSVTKSGEAPEVFGSGYLNPDSPYFDHAMDGVSCSFCHQIEDTVQLGTLDGFSGNYSVAEYINKFDRPAYGQYLDPVVGPMQNNVGFTPQFGAHIRSSALCATCHNVKTPFVDDSGNIASTSHETEFPEQMVYTEWENSVFSGNGAEGNTCQNCHMPTVTEDVKISGRPPWITPRSDFSQHDFLGANTVMMSILNDHRDQLGVSAQGFEAAIEKNRAFLKTAANIQLISPVINNGELSVQVKINNTTGHKLPSSYPSRRVFIHFVVSNEAGLTLFESGVLNSDGSIKDVDLDRDSTVFEPHYEVITQQDQVQVYEPIMADTNGAITHTLLRAADYLKDNRLPPKGFNKLNVPNDVRVVGVALDDDNFNDGSDTVTYKINVGNNSKLTIKAELKYQALSYGHLQDLFKDKHIQRVAEFKAMFDTATIRAETIASVSLIID